MILSTGGAAPGFMALAVAGMGAYALTACLGASAGRWAPRALWVALCLHILLLILEVAGPIGSPGVRLGFGPVLSLTVCLVLLVHALESRFVQLHVVRRFLAATGALAVALELAFPGEWRPAGSAWAPLHWLLGVGAYGLFGAAVLHALLLDAAERRLRLKAGPRSALSFSGGLPLLQLERMTFVFVQAGFAVLSAAIVLGMITAVQWRWDHKTVLSLVSWAVFAALLAGRQFQGWRGQRATRWLYVGVILLLLAYVGSRFVLEVVLGRAAG